MASAGLVTERLAAVSGFLPSTLDRMLRSLRAAELVPIGEPGRGQRSGQYEPQHLANVLLAFAGHQPSDAVDAATDLGAMRYAQTNPEGAPPPPNPDATLGEAVAEAIREAARFVEAQARQESRTFVPKVPAWISLSLSGARNALVKWRAPAHGPSRDDLYIPTGAYTTNDVVVRETTISQHLVYAAGDLWADTLARRGGDAATLDFLNRKRLSK